MPFCPPDFGFDIGLMRQATDEIDKKSSTEISDY
jgi:hypothetical protein